MKRIPQFPRLISRFRRRLSDDRTESAPMQPISDSVTDVGYFEQISYRYITLQIVAIMILAVYLAISLLTNTELLSTDNLIYFAKDLTTSISMQESAAKETLVYTADNSNAFALYREGLAILGKKKLTLFTATGRESYSHSLNYQNPALVASGRYLVAYDIGGKKFGVYNSFACVAEHETDTPIRALVASDAGYYAVITESSTGGSEVLLYNERHRPVNRYRLKQTTVCAAMKQDGQLLLASVTSENGRIVTHLTTAAIDATDYGTTFTVYDTYPVSVHYTEEGNIQLLTTAGLHLFDPDGRELRSVSFEAYHVLYANADGNGCVVVCRANNYNTSARTLIFDKQGELVYNIVTADTPQDVCYFDHRAALLQSDGISVFHQGEEAEKTIELKAEYRVLLVLDDTEFLVCADGKAITVRP